MSKVAKMKTERLYWKNQYQREFTAKILDIKEGIILNKTAFYPAGGGQVFDKGTLIKKNNPKKQFKVVAVEKKEEEIFHYLKNPKDSQLEINDIVVGKVNWNRRLSLMNGHTSQHILSALIEKKYRIKTIKAQIDVEEVAIYLEKKIPEKALIDVMQETNQFLLSENEITSKIYSKNEIPQEIRIQLRGNLQEKEQNNIRIVSIEGLDHSLCGGLHVNNTSSIGIINITNFRGDIINYIHGNKALKHQSEISLAQISIAKLLAAKPIQVKQRVKKLLEENSELKDLNSELNKLAVNYQLTEIKENPKVVNGIRLVTGNFQFIERKFLLQQVGPIPNDTIFVFIVKGPLLLVLSEISTLAANNLIQEYSQITDLKGGGSTKIAQAATKKPVDSLELMINIIEKRLAKNKT